MSFLDADAPMTAKCIMRDNLKEHFDADDMKAQAVVSVIVSQMRSWGYEIRPAEKSK